MWSWVSDGYPTQRQTCRVNVDLNIFSTSTSKTYSWVVESWLAGRQTRAAVDEARRQFRDLEEGKRSLLVAELYIHQLTDQTTDNFAFTFSTMNSITRAKTVHTVQWNTVQASRHSQPATNDASAELSNYVRELVPKFPNHFSAYSKHAIKTKSSPVSE
jgi:superfamily II DNA helicase RecQ